MLRAALGVLSCLLAVTTPAGAAAAPAPPGRLVVVAGTGENGYSGDGQHATDARISDEGGIAVAPDGSLYLADSYSGRVRVVRDGVIATVPDLRALRSPETDGPEVDGWRYSPSDRPRAVAAGPDGTLYVVGDSDVLRVTPVSSPAVVAETPVDDPSDIAVDGAGHVYVSGDGRVVRLDTGTTIAGGGALDPVAANGRPATEARLPATGVRIAADVKGAVYVVAPRASDTEQATLHRIDPDGTLHTVIGTNFPGFGGDGGPAAKANVQTLGGLAVGPHGEVYVFDEGNRVVRVVDARGRISSLMPPVSYGGDRYAPGQNAVAVGPHGEVFVKFGARVSRLTRERKPAPVAARTPSYPSRFPDDDAGATHAIAGNGRPEPQTGQPAVRKTESGLAVGPDGTRYYSDWTTNRVMKLAADGTSTVVAGNGKRGFSGDGGPATHAALQGPRGLTVGPDGSVYIADSGNMRLRKVDPQGVITTVAGNGSAGEASGSFGETVTVRGDGGPATAATVTPFDVDIAGDGSLFIAESDDMRIRRVAPDGTISTFAGGGTRWMSEADGHPATEATIFRPYAVTVAPDGRVYVLDHGVKVTWPWVRVIGTDGILRTAVGDSYRDEDEAGFGGDDGPATKAELNNPQDIDAGPDGTLYIADTYNSRIRAVDPAGTIRTIAGNGKPADTASTVNEPRAVTVAPDGTLYVVDAPGDRIRSIANGKIKDEFAKAKPAAGTPATRTAMTVTGLAVDTDGRLLISGSEQGLSEVDAHGTLTHTLPDLPTPQAVAVGPDGSRYVASVDKLYRVSGKAAPEVVAGGGPGVNGDEAVAGEPALIANFTRIQDVAVSPAGRVYIASDKAVYRLETNGTLTVPYDGDRVDGIAVDGEERLYVANTEANKVSRVVNGKPTTVAGNGEPAAEKEENTDATSASTYGPSDVAVDNEGNLYVSTYDGVRRVDPDGTITTITPDTPTGVLTVDHNGDLYYVAKGQVNVLVRPADLSGGFPWSLVLWLTAGVLAVAAAGWYFVTRSRRTKPKGAPAAEPAEAPAAEPADE